ncbi:hypothetical protein [Sphingopyxis panaciterrulae]|uniref:Uncharacterized protein n=1 Tax=Sphingopyxis panaciterrulae TaxID=462372 RepID=A0A7W9B3D5_9SPHN|nr:hypothetical protein [Sphingopyxis panaciterrulae]MBB5705216.1 hypothetical protein [Sphingopyxis panaciterrulae]
MAELWTAFFRECVAEREGGLPHLDITDAMYDEFGKAIAAVMEKIGQEHPEPCSTEDRTLYRVWLGVKTLAYEPCPIEFDYYQSIAKTYCDCGQITQAELDAYRTFSTLVRRRV